jgi:hypothetical protein
MLEETMSTIITHPAQEAHPRLDAAARHRADRLAKATNDQIQAALAYLSMIDPEASRCGASQMRLCGRLRSTHPVDERRLYITLYSCVMFV